MMMPAIAVVEECRGATPVTDPKFPQLREALDIRRMETVFARHLATMGMQTPEGLRCSILGTRYKPRSDCWITYRLQLPGMADERLIFAGQLMRERDAHPRSWAHSPVVLTDPKMRVWRFPSDPGLEGLDQVLDEHNLNHVLDRSDHVNADGCRTSDLEILKYVPRRRCVFRFAVSRGVGSGVDLIFGKVCDDLRSSTVFRSMQQLHELRAGRRPDGLRVPEPLGYDPARRFLWHRWCGGEDFVSFARWRGRRGFTHGCVASARVLALLHTSAAVGPPVHLHDELTRKLRERSRLLQRFQPELTPTLERVVAKLMQYLPRERPSRRVFIHGDFNHSQILFQKEGPVLIDFDVSGIGDPLFDVALFMTGLHRLAEDGEFARRTIGDGAVSFLETYRQRVPWEVSERRLRIYIAWALICRRAHRAVRCLEQNTFERVRNFVNLAGEYLDEQ